MPPRSERGVAKNGSAGPIERTPDLAHSTPVETLTPPPPSRPLAQALLLFWTVILIISLCMAFLYVPAKMKRAPFTLSGDTDACFARSETVCDTHAVSTFYFWNLTNADAVVAGTAPPALREIGPFVMHKGKEKKSNVTFHGAREDRVSYVATSYAEWDESSFCEGCALDDVVVSFNPAYYTLVHTFGSETNFLYSLTPRVVPPLVDAIAAVFLALAADPTTAAAMPHVAAAAADPTGASIRALALAQWGDCSPLGGASITTLALPAETLALFPVAPEFGAYADAAAGAAMDASAAGVSGDALDDTYAALTTDDTGVAVLGLLQTPDAVLAASLGVSAVHAQFVKGYVVHVAGSYGRAAGADAMGPFLGPSSSGLFVARTVREWILGYADPLTSSRYEPSDPRYLVRAVTKTFHADDLEGPNAVDRVPTTVEDTSLWPGLGATPWTVATGKDDPDRALDVLVSTKGDALNDTYAYAAGGGDGWNETVRGKLITRAVYPSIERDGVGGSATAWFDFGNSLDMGRAVNLEYAGRYHLPHESVKLHVFRVAKDDLLPCPTSTRACRFGSRFHGAWDVSEHRDIPTVTTMPHGHRADPRLWGYVDLADPDSPFKPNATAHEMEWDVLQLSGNVLGARLRYQNNFQVKPTDVFYPNVWQPAAASDLDAPGIDDGMYVPIAWGDVSFRVPDSKINDIAAIITEAKGLVALYVVALPGFSFLFIAYAGVVLYIRHHVARGRKKIEDEYKARDAAKKNVEGVGVDPFAGVPPLGPSVVNPSNDARAWTRRGDDGDCSTVVVNVGEVNAAK